VLSSTFLAIAVAALVWAELKSSRLGTWLTKPVASTLFIVTALLAGALASSYGRLILLGLFFSWLGDVFLIPKRQIFFIAGLGSFLLAHLAFSAAFLLQQLEVLPLALAATATVVFAIIILRWLWPHLSHKFRPAVVSYLGAISLMVVLAAGTMATAGLNLLIGAVMFAVSDIFVARDRFVSPSVANRLWGLPLYYGAQLIFALSTQDH
jgi:uncharacterized membrane protein YhhN